MCFYSDDRNDNNIVYREYFWDNISSNKSSYHDRPTWKVIQFALKDGGLVGIRAWQWGTQTNKIKHYSNLSNTFESHPWLISTSLPLHCQDWLYSSSFFLHVNSPANPGLWWNLSFPFSGFLLFFFCLNMERLFYCKRQQGQIKQGYEWFYTQNSSVLPGKMSKN